MAAIFEEFANGDDFNASDFNTYSMRQAIIACDNQTDRDSIATPQEGMTVYRKDLGQYEVYSGSAWHKRPGENPIACKVTRSSSQSITSGLETLVDWNAEDYDYNSMHDNVTNNTRITIPEAGIYVVSANLTWQNSGTGITMFRILKNGTIIQTVNMPNVPPGGDGELNGMYVGLCAANDYFEIRAYHTQGSARNLLAASFFQAHKI